MEFVNIFPVRIRQTIPKDKWDGLEEIRIRAKLPVEFLYADRKSLHFGVVEKEEIREMMNYLSGYSLYAMADELKEGFFTMKGGHRVGVVGRVAREEASQNGKNGICGIYDFSGLNIRIAYEKKGCAKQLVQQIRQGDSIHNTLILAPPGAGKTTYLRDSIRILSYGDPEHMGLKIAVVDERSEIAACYQGIPQNDLGPRTDVLDNCPKERGIFMMLRSMSPQIIAVDELGKEEDFMAVYQAVCCGSRILGTVHAQRIRELSEKPYMCKILEARMIDRFVLLNRELDGTRKMQIYDETMRRIC